MADSKESAQKQITSVEGSRPGIVLLQTLPIELIYRILDHLDEREIVLTARNVCQRLDSIIDTYYTYQVRL